MYSITKISEIISAEIIGNTDCSIQHLLIDSRQLTDASNTLFVALTSNRNDGHKYINQLIEQGVKSFIVQEIPANCLHQKQVCFLKVNNTLNALQTLARFHRLQYQLPIIGITGSNGKTIVKEWLFQLLQTNFNIVRSPKSYNSQVGVPLSVWQIQAHHTLGIFEAGISTHNEMQHLNQIIQPTIGVLTSLGAAHNEGFDSMSEKLSEKCLLFKNTKTLIVNALSINDDLVKEIKHPSLFIISKHKGATLQVTHTNSNTTHTTIHATYQNQQHEITVPFTDAASIENVITCWAVLLHLNISHKEICERVLNLVPVAMRLELKLGNNNCVLINDFYNSDINALEIALHHLKQQNRTGKSVLILSDIEQSGKPIEELYTYVAKLIQQFKIDLLVGIGKEISSQSKLFKTSSYFFETTQEFINKNKLIPELQFKDSIILLKGARSFAFENISKTLQQKSHDTVLEINLNHLIHNINFYKSQISKETLMMCMVKATGYGSGSTEIAFTLQHHHVDYLAVAYTDEGVELRRSGIHLPIMVMSPEESSYDDMIEYNLEPEIYSLKVLKEFIAALHNKGISTAYPIHLKLDTGMHRLGFEPSQVQELCYVLNNTPELKVKSIFSHLVGSDDKALDEFTNGQIKIFKETSQVIEHAIGYSAIKHICNSAAITRFKDAHFNMVRLGIGMYGVGLNDVEKKNLLNISSLKTKISQIKHLTKGSTVGYNRKGEIHQPTVIATIPIGYADGFSRKLGNGNAVVYVNQKACRTIGNICMDMCMIDVTTINCKEGDTVVIFNNTEQLMNLSKAMNTIPYELLTSISSRVKRVYVQE